MQSRKRLRYKFASWLVSHKGDVKEESGKINLQLGPDKPNINYFAYFSYYQPPWNQLVSRDASFHPNEV